MQDSASQNTKYIMPASIDTVSSILFGILGTIIGVTAIIAAAYQARRQIRGDPLRTVSLLEHSLYLLDCS